MTYTLLSKMLEENVHKYIRKKTKSENNSSKYVMVSVIGNSFCLIWSKIVVPFNSSLF